MPPARQGHAAEERSGEGDEIAHCGFAPDLGFAANGPAGCHCTALCGAAQRNVSTTASHRVADCGKMARNPGVWRAVARRGARWHVIVTCDRDCCPSRRSG